MVTGVKYIPRAENSEKRYKKENVTILILNKKNAAERLPKQFGENVQIKRWNV